MKRPSINELTLEEKIGQLLMVAQYPLLVKVVDGEEIPRTQDEIDEIMKKCQFGSIWGQGGIRMKNVNLAEETAGEKMTAAGYKKFLARLEKNLRIPFLVGMDCENGATLVEGGTSISGPLSIGAADDEKLTYDLAQSVAKEMRAAGGNWRWSPVVDMFNRFCGVSSGRTYSDNADKIIKHAVAAVKGTESAGVASTVKHFPGMDPYEIRDGHFTETMINISLDEWRNTQAKTFRGVFEAGVDTVMVGHIAFPAADDTKVNGRYLPATISDKIIKEILREEMGFDGVVITDGIGMASLQTICPFEEVLIRAINAGNDILLGVGPSAAETVKQAVLDGRIPMERIDESAERVLKLKEKIGLFDDEEEEFDIFKQSEITRKIDREIAEKSVTLVRERCKLIPVNKEDIKKVTIVCSSHYSGTIKELEAMKAEFEARGAKVDIIEDLPENGSQVKILAEENDLLVYAAYIAPHRPMGMPSLYGKKMETFFNAFSHGKEKSIGVSLGYPYMHIDFMGNADVFFNLYAPNPEAMRAFVMAVYGEIEPTTKSPVDIEPKLRYVFG